MSESPVALLLLEDDPVSAQFLAAALAPIAAPIVLAGSLAQARQNLAQRRFALMLLDLHLPDGSGTELLALDPTPAIALSAELDGERRRTLLQLGFVEVLHKPLTGEALRASVRRCLNHLPEHLGEPRREPPLWNQAAAMAACGDKADVLSALRVMLSHELPGQLERLRAAILRGDQGDALEELHRLRAACGFCGAADLGAAVAELSAALRAGSDSNVPVTRLQASADRLLQNLSHATA